jgi:hypothetical protein
MQMGMLSALNILLIIKISNRRPLLFGYGRGEIRVLVRHPIDEFAKARVGQQTVARFVAS